jgi:hypothetical protein
MSCGGLVLDTKNAVEHSKALATVGPVSEEIMRKYIQIWKEIGLLSSVLVSIVFFPKYYVIEFQRRIL